MKDLKIKAIRLVNNGKFKIVKYSPEIFTILGIAGTAVATVLACKKTLKVKEILDQRKETLDSVEFVSNSKQYNGEYSEEDKKNDIRIINTQAVVGMIKEYAIPGTIYILSIASIINGHRILRKRNAAIAAAYGLVTKAFEKYRENVIEKYGQGEDQALRFGIKAKEIKTKDKDGKTKKEIEYEIDKDSVSKTSPYARFFDAASKDFEKDPEYNLMFLRSQQNYANELLKSRGHVFLNEVYDLLDIPRTQAGQVVGWIYDPNNPKCQGDNYIDFGIYDNNDLAKRRFVNGLEYNILLDFNVDGVIYDKI